MAQSKIEWTEMTWNPVTGCTKISTGCNHCYAEVMAKRLKAMGAAKYMDAFSLRLHEAELEAPKAWAKPRTVFVNSMSDLFHKQVPLEFIERVFTTMSECPQHRFQVLTKRARRLRQIGAALLWTPNIWMGVSVEDRKRLWRIDELRETPAKVKFLSLEPLLSDLPGLNLEGIDWVIVGGESGPGARPIDPIWVLRIRDRCAEAGVPFFFKQWGGVNKKRSGRLLEGKVHNGMPRRVAA